MTPAGVAVVGCGNIAGRYAELMGGPELRLCGFTDVDPARAQAFAARYGGHVYPDLDAVLADPDVSIVVNLTVHTAHYAVVRRCLEAGTAVHSEKPLALSAAEARELVALAETTGVRLSCAPGNLLGEAAQTMFRAVRDGRLGRVRVVYAEANWGRLESWHPAPAGFYAVGPLVDVGVYPLTLATAMFGPARRVTAHGAIVHPHRVGSTGEPFTVTTPDFSVCLIELAGGVLLRLTCAFYVPQHSAQRGMELHGDDGSLYLSDWQQFDAAVEWAPFAGPREPLAYVRPPFRGIDWSRSVRELARAVAEDRPHRLSGAHAAHVVEILDAARESTRTGRPVTVGSGFPTPAPMPWAT